MSMSVLAHTLNQMRVSTNRVSRVTESKYQEWASTDAILDGLRGIRYGQSFCNRFSITDYLLYFTNSLNYADDYIRKNYVIGDLK